MCAFRVRAKSRCIQKIFPINCTIMGAPHLPKYSLLSIFGTLPVPGGMATDGTAEKLSSSVEAGPGEGTE